METSAPPSDPEPPYHHRYHPRLGTWHPLSVWHSLKLRPRLLLAVGAGLSALLALPLLFPGISGEVRSALAWCMGGAVYLVGAFHTMSAVDAQKIKSAAAKQDEGRGAILLILLLAIAASFAAILALQGTIRTADTARGWLIALAAGTIVVSWLVTQIVFTMHYAHDYYRPDATERDAEHGLKFPGTDEPDYWDFFYFATSLGAASQTSDVSITSRALRRLVTLHCIVAFLFNTSILALTINLAASAAAISCQSCLAMPLRP